MLFEMVGIVVLSAELEEVQDEKFHLDRFGRLQLCNAAPLCSRRYGKSNDSKYGAGIIKPALGPSCSHGPYLGT